jgi:hypothetical protein
MPQKTTGKATTAKASGKPTGKSPVSASPNAKRQATAPATKTPATSRGGGKGKASTSERGSSEAMADSGADGRAAPKHITAQEAMENTRDLLAAKQARARKPPAWQELDHTQHAKAAKPGFESEAARDRAVELHQDEMRLQATEGSISDRDRHQQGRRDSR